MKCLLRKELIPRQPRVHGSQRMSKGIFAVCVAALLCWTSEAAADSITEGSGTPDLKLLFVGNSLIYFNGGVHKVVAGLLHDEFPSAIIKADQVAGPNFLFTQHLDNAQKPGTAQWETLGPNSTDHWDFVLFQEESQQVAFGGVSNSASLDALEQLTKLAAARGAKVAVDLTWAWLDGKNPSFPVFKDMQAKVDAGYAADMQELISSTGVAAFLAPVGLGWQVVNDLVDAAKTGSAKAPSSTVAVLAQSQRAEQSASVALDATPVHLPTPQICPQGVRAEGEVSSPVQAPAGEPAASQSGAPDITRPAADSSRPQALAVAPEGEAEAPAAAAPLHLAGQAPADAGQSGAVRLPNTVASLPFVAGRRLKGVTAGAEGMTALAEPDLAGGAAMRRLLQAQQPGAVSSVSGGEPTGASAAAAQGISAMQGEPFADAAPAPNAAALQAPVQAPTPVVVATVSEQMHELTPILTYPDEEEGRPASDHESVTEQAQANAPAPAQGASLEASAGDFCSPKALPEGLDTFTKMYAPDGNHPSMAGTYLQGLIIASSMTGCRMKGNGFTSGLEPKWYTFLQELSDAIVFEGTPPQFAPYPWSTSGPKCTLKP